MTVEYVKFSENHDRPALYGYGVSCLLIIHLIIYPTLPVFGYICGAICACTCMYACMCLRVYVWVCVFVFMCLFVRVCIYVSLFVLVHSTGQYS